jgi:hypothetical protein
MYKTRKCSLKRVSYEVTKFEVVLKCVIANVVKC